MKHNWKKIRLRLARSKAKQDSGEKRRSPAAGALRKNLAKLPVQIQIKTLPRFKLS